MRALILALPALLSAGCVSDAQLSAQAESNLRRKMELYGPVCEKVGFQRDTDAWRLCVVEIHSSGRH